MRQKPQKRIIRIFEGDGPDRGKFGVAEGNAIIYLPEFPKDAAKRIAELERGVTPPLTWEETRKLLEGEGFVLE